MLLKTKHATSRVFFKKFAVELKISQNIKQLFKAKTE